jgi:hypothetical protein
MRAVSLEKQRFFDEKKQRRRAKLKESIKSTVFTG